MTEDSGLFTIGNTELFTIGPPKVSTLRELQANFQKSWK